MTSPLSYRAIATLAWPIVLANASVPLLGLVDTAVIGNVGTVAELGAVALGAVVFSFVFWGFGFLRMGTTGFVAQAAGQRDSAEVRAIAARGLLLALAIGLALLVLQRPIAFVALALLDAAPEVNAHTARYIAVRIWAAPASLATFTVLGVLVGLGRTRPVLVVQLVLNGTNIMLDVLLAGVWRLGVAGIALGTALAEWVAALVALGVLVRVVREEQIDVEPWWPSVRLRDRTRAVALLRANGDLMVRTLFLLLGFGWFANRGATFGAALLAANHVLLQLVSTAAYLLDGFAHATEVLVGRAIGRGDAAAFRQVLRRSTVLAAASAFGLAAFALFGGEWAVARLTAMENVRVAAEQLLPFAATYIALSFAAFQLDGVFIGATATRRMRNASIGSCLGFIVLSFVTVPRGGAVGLWLAFIGFVVLRAVLLGLALPGIRVAHPR